MSEQVKNKRAEFTMIPIGNLSRNEWLQLRKNGIGGSDAGAICGLNPYASPLSVYMDKTGGLEEKEDNEAMRQGRDLEEYVARRFWKHYWMPHCWRGILRNS